MGFLFFIFLIQLSCKMERKYKSGALTHKDGENMFDLQSWVFKNRPWYVQIKTLGLLYLNTRFK